MSHPQCRLYTNRDPFGVGSLDTPVARGTVEAVPGAASPTTVVSVLAGRADELSEAHHTGFDSQRS